MSDVVRTTAKDGSQVEFIYKDPAQGAVKDVYFAPDKSYVVAFFRNPLDPQGKERIENIVGKYRHDLFEQEGGEYWKDIFCWPEKIVEYDGRLGLVVPAYEKCYFFDSEPLKGAEKEGKWFASAKNFNKFVPPDEKGNLLSFLRVCIRLSRGVRRLHAAGLAHSDLSYKNCLVDPKTGSACIIDVDGLVVPGLFPPDVLGTPDFMAPEVVATADGPKENRELPKRTTDLHALAVLIYQYLLHLMAGHHGKRRLKGHSLFNAPDDLRMVHRFSVLQMMVQHQPVLFEGFLPSAPRQQRHIMPGRAENMRKIAADHAGPKHQYLHFIALSGSCSGLNRFRILPHKAFPSRFFLSVPMIILGLDFTNAAGQEAPTSISWGGMPDLAAYYNVYCA